jgi:hypothetical protein
LLPAPSAFQILGTRSKYQAHTTYNTQDFVPW